MIAASLIVFLSANAMADGERWQADPSTGCLMWNSHPRPTDVFTWSGSCSNGYAEGRGTSTWSYVDDHGRKVEYVFEVNMKGGRIVGNGIVHYPDGSVYEGELKDGLPHGRGSYTFGKHTSNSGDRFVGAFVQGRIGKDGRYTSSDGSSYSGAFVDGLPEGHGRQIFANGRTFEGPFRKGMAHGKGICSDEDHDRRRCQYRLGRFAGWLL